MRTATEAGRKNGQLSRTVLLLCMTVIIIDGADVVIYGTALPSLLDYKPWAMSTQTAGAIGSYALIGLLLGALMSGYFSDRFGRRRPIIVYTILFSLLTAMCSVATSATMFGVTRFLVGLALGGVLPMAVTLALDYAPPDRKNFFNGTAMMGYPLGSLLIPLVAIVVLPSLGFRALFLIAGLIGIAIVPILLWKLPESLQFLVATGRVDEARRLSDQLGVELGESTIAQAVAKPEPYLRRVRAMFTVDLRTTILIPLAGFFGVLLATGLTTWLPQLLRDAGYSLGSSLAFLMAMNIGQIIGQLVLSRIADRVGARNTIAAAFAGAAVCIFGMSFELPGGTIYALVLAAGFGALTAQAMLYGFGGILYPTETRGTAVGWVMGISRIGGVFGPIAGALLLSLSGSAAAFYGFAVAGLCAALGVVAVRKRPPEEPAAVG